MRRPLAILLIALSATIRAVDDPAQPTPAMVEHHHQPTFAEQVATEDQQIDVLQRQIAAINRKEHASQTAFVEAWIRRANLADAKVDQEDGGSTDFQRRLMELNREMARLREFRDILVYPPKFFHPDRPMRAEQVWTWMHGASVTLYSQTRGQCQDPGPRSLDPPPPVVVHQHQEPQEEPQLAPIPVGLPGANTPPGYGASRGHQ